MPRLTSKYLNSALLLFLLSGLDILHRLGRLPPAAKRLKGDTVAPLGASSSVVAVPSPVGRGGSGARTSPARSSSRGQEGRSSGGPAPVAPLILEAPFLDAVTEVAKAQEVPAS